MRIQPVIPRIDIHLDGHVERQRIHHLLFDERAHRLFLVRRRLEDEFVVDLEEQAAAESLGFHPPVDVHHGDLDHVGLRALGLVTWLCRVTQ